MDSGGFSILPITSTSVSHYELQPFLKGFFFLHLFGNRSKDNNEEKSLKYFFPLLLFLTWAPWKELWAISFFVTESAVVVINGQQFEFILFQINLDLDISLLLEGARTRALEHIKYNPNLFTILENWLSRLEPRAEEKRQTRELEIEEFIAGNWHDVRAPNYIFIFTVYIARWHSNAIVFYLRSACVALVRR